jgi:hypothetical protein
MIATVPTVPSIESEFEGADLGDARLNRRLRITGARLALKPDASLPDALDENLLGRCYALANHPKIAPEDILAPHFGATVKRCLDAQDFLAIHDTTEVAYGGKRKGMGYTKDSKSGYFAHISIGLTADGLRRPLGALGLYTWTRPEPVKKKKRGRKSRSGRHAYGQPKETDRWEEQAQAVEEACGPGRAIHVMDREGDAYDLLSSHKLNKRRFVQRANHDRTVLLDGARAYMSTLLRTAPLFLERERVISKRALSKQPLAAKQHPPRETRLAKFEVRATPVLVVRPKGWPKDLPKTLEMNLVYVREIDCPPGQTAVEWRLFTSEPIDTPEQVARVVDHYLARWTIEEFFKALKTGCALESRELESYHGLLNLLAIYIPIAWSLLLLRTLERDTPEAPAGQVLSQDQIDALRVAIPKANLPELPTVHQAMMAIALLGGFLKHNGKPGWQILLRGFTSLLAFAAGWTAARRSAAAHPPGPAGAPASPPASPKDLANR